MLILFWRQRSGVCNAPHGPLCQPLVGGQTPSGDIDEVTHGAPRHVEGARMRLGKGVIQVIPSHSHNEFASEDATGHVAVQHEAEAAEHLLLTEAGAPGEQFPNAVGQVFVIGHLEYHHGAEDLAALHLVEGVLYVADGDGLGHETVEVEAALQVQFDEHREVAGGQAVAVPG